VRVAYFGSSQFSCLVLRQLLASEHTVVAIVTQPDQPAGRRMTLCPTDVCRESYNLGLPVLKPERLRNNAAFRQQLRELKPEALLVASYGQIIPPRVLELTQWPLNVHPSLLPRLRGASPVRTALLQGLPTTGCCIIRMTPRLDDGDILLVKQENIRSNWNYADLESSLGHLGGKLAVNALTEVSAGTATLTPQDHALATYTSIHTRDDTWIDWDRSKWEVRNFIRAWDPDVGALTLLPDGRRLKVWRAMNASPVMPEITEPPGTVVAVQKDRFTVACQREALWITEVQPENKRRMDVASFLAGHKLSVGDRLGQRP
jgi:methionyl-tRNA formyltransferase